MALEPAMSAQETVLSVSSILSNVLLCAEDDLESASRVSKVWRATALAASRAIVERRFPALHAAVEARHWLNHPAGPLRVVRILDEALGGKKVDEDQEMSDITALVAVHDKTGAAVFGALASFWQCEHCSRVHCGGPNILDENDDDAIVVLPKEEDGDAALERNDLRNLRASISFLRKSKNELSFYACGVLLERDHERGLLIGRINGLGDHAARHGFSGHGCTFPDPVSYVIRTVHCSSAFELSTTPNGASFLTGCWLEFVHTGQDGDDHDHAQGHATPAQFLAAVTCMDFWPMRLLQALSGKEDEVLSEDEAYRRWPSYSVALFPRELTAPWLNGALLTAFSQIAASDGCSVVAPPGARAATFELLLQLNLANYDAPVYAAVLQVCKCNCENVDCLKMQLRPGPAIALPATVVILEREEESQLCVILPNEYELRMCGHVTADAWLLRTDGNTGSLAVSRLWTGAYISWVRVPAGGPPSTGGLFLTLSQQNLCTHSPLGVSAGCLFNNRMRALHPLLWGDGADETFSDGDGVAVSGLLCAAIHFDASTSAHPAVERYTSEGWHALALAANADLSLYSCMALLDTAVGEADRFDTTRYADNDSLQDAAQRMDWVIVAPPLAG